MVKQTKYTFTLLYTKFSDTVRFLHIYKEKIYVKNNMFIALIQDNIFSGYYRLEYHIRLFTG